MQNYVVPAIYSDMSNQGQGYFAFRFTCQECQWQIDTRPIRAQSSNVSAALDIGVGFLNGFWGRAAEVGEQVYGTQWHKEQADALQRSWVEVQPQFRLCPQCHRTVCLRCFNQQRTLCTNCAPDKQADAMHFQQQMDIEAQHKYIQENYHPSFDAAVAANAPHIQQVPQVIQSQPVPVPQMLQAQQAQQSSMQSVACPTCQHMGTPGKFCQECGTKLPLPDRTCPACNARVEGAAKFCAECGARL